MRFDALLMAAATQAGGAAAGGGELFPDPTLAHVADDVNGWAFSDGFPTFGPAGGTGPDIVLAAAFADSDANLAEGGTDDVAFAAAVANSSTKTVALTISGYVSGSVKVSLKQGTQVTFTPSGNGVISQSVTAGTVGNGSFRLQVATEGTTFNITAISVTTP